jgi:hypothetical protein
LEPKLGYYYYYYLFILHRAESYCEGVGSGRQHRAKVEGVHRTMSLVQQTPPYGVRCGAPRSRKKEEKERMLSWLLGCWSTEL